eukprot:gene10717-9403_t
MSQEFWRAMQLRELRLLDIKKDGMLENYTRMFPGATWDARRGPDSLVSYNPCLISDYGPWGKPPGWPASPDMLTSFTPHDGHRGHNPTGRRPGQPDNF